jgi:leader peptidase (prepilin peptidase)/N-methyltransferase
MLDTIFDSRYWAPVPPGFWALVFFVLGSMVGSFLNVVIYRLPLGLSVVTPPSHCPHCKYSIPWFLNVPLVTWMMLGGKCRNCRAPISPRYFLVELLTGLTFLACWSVFGGSSALLALAMCLFLSGLIAATFIDFEHYIIPDEITLGGAMVGFVLSFFLPGMHGEDRPVAGLISSMLGIAIGGGVVYGILRLGKVMFGRQRVEMNGETRVVFTDSAIVLPDQLIPYEDIFYRKSDTVTIQARCVELVDRGYAQAQVRVSLMAGELLINDEKLDPESCVHMEMLTSELVLPREAMGLGDVKFMAAIGAFLGWQATVFSLLASSVIGAAVGVTLIVCGKREWSSRLPYGPYIAMAAALWVFFGWGIWRTMFPPYLPLP